MKLSTKGRYAVMAMADIGSQPGGGRVALADVAQRQDISQEYLEQLFSKLRRAGLVESQRGPGGGYWLSRPADAICIADIISAVDEPMQVTRCQGDAIDGCVKGEKCVTHELWAALGRQVYGFLSASDAWRCRQPAQPGAGSLHSPCKGTPGHHADPENQLIPERLQSARNANLSRP
jgi:Rrf2 family iron-sulfur cluster assembly transcriptional regulator